MRRGKWISVLLAGVLLVSGAAAETMPALDHTPLPVYAPADMAPEDVRAFVEVMFAAATGTDVDQEKQLRKDMTPEEQSERNAANADYRARTIPWLIAAFAPEETEKADETQAPVSTPEPTPAPTLDPETPPVYTPEDSYLAFAEREAGAKYLDLMESLGANGEEECLLLTREICGMWMAQVDQERLLLMNEDYRCWIYAPDTPIDYPVVQSEDNSHYLRRMFNGEYNSAGTLFMDYRNLPDFRDPNTLIYGHNMRNNSMFGTLTDYWEQEYYEGHPLMLIMSPERIFLLEIFAGYLTTENDHCYDIAISDERDMEEFVDSAREKSDFDSAVQVNAADRLVTLSTCAYAFDNARYILMGRILPIWEKEAETAPVEDPQTEEEDAAEE